MWSITLHNFVHNNLIERTKDEIKTNFSLKLLSDYVRRWSVLWTNVKETNKVYDQNTLLLRRSYLQQHCTFLQFWHRKATLFLVILTSFSQLSPLVSLRFGAALNKYFKQKHIDKCPNIFVLDNSKLAQFDLHYQRESERFLILMFSLLSLFLRHTTLWLQIFRIWN